MAHGTDAAAKTHGSESAAMAARHLIGLECNFDMELSHVASLLAYGAFAPLKKSRFAPGGPLGVWAPYMSICYGRKGPLAPWVESPIALSDVRLTSDF